VDRWQAFVVLYASASVVALSAAVGAWRHRRTAPAAVPLTALMLGLGWWSATETAGAFLPDGLARELTVPAMIAGVGVVVAGFFWEARTLVRGAWTPSRRILLLLAVHPVVATVLAFTNPWHHVFATYQYGAGEPWLPWRPGILFWIHAAYCYAMLTWSFVVVGRGLRSSTSPLHRRQLRSILAAAVVPTIGNVITLSRGNHLIGPDLTPAFMLATALIHYYAVFRQGLLSLLPVARELVLENVSDAIFVVDIRGHVIDLNPAGVRLARRLTANLPGSLIGVQARRLLPPTRYRRALTDGEYHLEHADGVIDIDLRVNDLADRQGRPLGRVVVARDVTEINDQRRRLADVNGRLLEQLEIIDRLRGELAELAVRDELTGLYNRRHLLAQLDTELERARSDAAPLAVVLLDIDHFKSVNDRFGHAVGDLLLSATARTLDDSVRTGDTVARYGGEEFVILLPRTGIEQGLACAETLRSRCATVLVDSRTGPVSTTVSVGVAAFPDCGWTSAALLQSADEALYAAKHAGRDRVVAANLAS
jgi:diguanylate cyclase (GGDEF)-like protein